MPYDFYDLPDDLNRQLHTPEAPAPVPTTPTQSRNSNSPDYDPFFDPAATPSGDDAVWNPLLRRWMSTSGNPYSGGFGTAPTAPTAPTGGSDSTDPFASYGLPDANTLPQNHLQDQAPTAEVQAGRNPMGLPITNDPQPFHYDPLTNTATGFPTTDEEWDLANSASFNQGVHLYGAPAGTGWLDGIGITQAPGSSLTPELAQLFLQQAQQAGVPEAWITQFLAQNPGDFHRLMGDYFSPGGQGYADYGISGGGGTGAGGAQGGGTPPFPDASGFNYQSPNLPNQFDDPITGPLETYAQGRAQNLENPPEGSGQNAFEAALNQIAQQFGSGGFTNAEQELFQTQSLDPLEQLRADRKQQVMLSLSQRGIDPNSGVAIQMLQDVDREFDQMRTSTQAGLGQQFAQERVARMLQAVQLLSQLAGTQDRRLDKAFEYRGVPLDLADRSFNQALQLTTQANPLQMVNPLMQLYNSQLGQNQASQQALGYLAYILSNGGQQNA